MLNGLYLSAMGAKVQDARSDVLANNLANMNTTAFRRDQAVFRMRLSAAAEQPELAQRSEPRYEPVGGGVFLARIATLDEPGPLEATGRPLDLAVDGEGFLRVQGADGKSYYTRAGNLKRDDAGLLTTRDGRYHVQAPGGGNIDIPPGQVNITEDGQLFVDGVQQGQIALVMPSDLSLISKRGDSLWAADGPVSDVPASGKLRQGFLEGSSVEPMREMSEMIEAQRTYEMNLKAMTIQDQILARTVSDVGRSSGGG